METKIDPTVQQPSKFNSLEAARTSPEFVVQFLEQVIGAKLTTEKKAAVLSVISDLPEGATMRDLYEAIKVQEAATLGVTPDQYEALSPVLEALQGLLAPGAYVSLFEHPADA
jgi:hypothetical protein